MRRLPLYALFLADGISLSGNAVAQLAIPWYVLITTGSPSLTGLAVFFTVLPTVLAGFFGGVIVDRLGFRTTSVVADLASAGAVAAIPLLHSTVGIELWQLMTLAFVGALLDAPGATARLAVFPDVVALAGVGMERANGIRSAIQRGSFMVGAPVGGVLVAELGATTALWLDAASFLLSAALVVAAVPRAARAPRPETPGRYFAELAEGIRFIAHHRLFRAIVATILITNLLDAPFPVVMPVFALEAFGSAKDLGLLYGVAGGAALAGSLAYSAVGHRLPRRPTFVWCFALTPLVYLALATLPPLPLALAALAASGLVSGPINPLINTVMFEIVPADLRGRVFGAIRAASWASIPLGVLVGGVVVEAIGVPATFLAIGVCYVLVTLYGFFNAAFRELDVPPRAAEPAAEGVASPQMPLWEERAGRNEALFREVNEEVAALGERVGLDPTSTEFLCECADAACTEHLELPLSEYEQVRAHPRRFIVKAGHEAARALERVVERREGYLIVEKQATAGEVAEQNDPPG